MRMGSNYLQAACKHSAGLTLIANIQLGGLSGYGKKAYWSEIRLQNKRWGDTLALCKIITSKVSFSYEQLLLI